MAADRFAAVLARVLRHEGGFSDHPRDPGGATMQGVTQRTYDGFRDRRGLARGSVRRIGREELRAIYASGYWVPPRCAELPLGLDYAVFDWAVNSGPRRAVKGLQRALGVTADGVVGPVTLAAARAAPVERSINRLCDRRLGFKRRLPTWADFGRGWTRRVEDVRRVALAEVSAAELAAAPVLSPPEPTTPTPTPSPLGRFWRALVDLLT